MSRRLTLPLKKKWFDMIKSGEKKEEYREITDYWRKRLCWNFKDMTEACSLPINGTCEHCIRVHAYQFDEIEFTCGYPKKEDKERRLLFKNPKICVTYGLTDWGAEQGKKYFVITWDK